MSAEDYVKEISRGIARRHVKRGYLWLLRNAGWFVADFWLMNLRVYVPEGADTHSRDHVLVAAFAQRRLEAASVPPWVRGVMARSPLCLSHVVEHYKLTPQFMTSHGFMDDGVITLSLLNEAWHEAVYVENYHLEHVPPQALPRAANH